VNNTIAKRLNKLAILLLATLVALSATLLETRGEHIGEDLNKHYATICVPDIGELNLTIRVFEARVISRFIIYVDIMLNAPFGASMVEATVGFGAESDLSEGVRVPISLGRLVNIAIYIPEIVYRPAPTRPEAHTPAPGHTHTHLASPGQEADLMPNHHPELDVLEDEDVIKTIKKSKQERPYEEEAPISLYRKISKKVSGIAYNKVKSHRNNQYSLVDDCSEDRINIYAIVNNIAHLGLGSEKNSQIYISTQRVNAEAKCNATTSWGVETDGGYPVVVAAIFD